MPKGKDYTVMPLGARIDDGEIKVCPECGRRGLAVDDLDVHKTYYTHVQAISGTVVGGEAFTGLDWHMVEMGASTPPASE